MEKVNLAQKFSLFDEYWSPRIAGELNDSYVTLASSKASLSGITTRLRMNCSSS